MKVQGLYPPDTFFEKVVRKNDRLYVTLIQ